MKKKKKHKLFLGSGIGGEQRKGKVTFQNYNNLSKKYTLKYLVRYSNIKSKFGFFLGINTYEMLSSKL